MPMIIWLMPERARLLAWCRGLALLIAISFVLFYYWPTAVARPEMPLGHYFFYSMIVRADLPHNACPSLHAAFGVFTAGCAWELGQRWKNRRLFIGAAWLWTAAVLFSTLLIKQHVVLDLIAGGTLGWLSWWAMARCATCNAHACTANTASGKTTG